MKNGGFNQTLTAEDAEKIADGLLQFEGSLQQYVAENPDLSNDEKMKMEKLQEDVHLRAEQIYTAAVGLIIDDAQASLEKIQQTTQAAKDAIRNLQIVQEVIDIAAGVIKIGASVASGDIGDIVSGIEQVEAALASGPHTTGGDPTV